MSKDKKVKILCIFSGVLCVLLVFAYTQTVKSSSEKARIEAMEKYGGEQIEVCVAKRDIAAGESIESYDIEQKIWIADLLPKDAVRNIDSILGKQATSSIIKGEVVSEKRFQENAISLEVPAGLSAVSVPAKNVSALGGALSAGMHIDIYSTGNISTYRIANNILVLATSASINENSSSSNACWITVAVEPGSVQELVSASQNSSLYFVLPSKHNASEEDSNLSNTNSREYKSSKDASESPNKTDKHNSDKNLMSSSGASKS